MGFVAVVFICIISCCVFGSLKANDKRTLLSLIENAQSFVHVLLETNDTWYDNVVVTFQLGARSVAWPLSVWGVGN